MVIGFFLALFANLLLYLDGFSMMTLGGLVTLGMIGIGILLDSLRK